MNLYRSNKTIWRGGSMKEDMTFEEYLIYCIDDANLNEYTQFVFIYDTLTYLVKWEKSVWSDPIVIPNYGWQR